MSVGPSHRLIISIHTIHRFKLTKTISNRILIILYDLFHFDRAKFNEMEGNEYSLNLGLPLLCGSTTQAGSFPLVGCMVVGEVGGFFFLN